jgi:hypothetical protein
MARSAVFHSTPLADGASLQKQQWQEGQVTDRFFERHWHQSAEERSIDALQWGHGSVAFMFVPFDHD